MKGMGYKYEGHDSGTKAPSKAPAGYSSPATHCNVSDGATSVNQKNPSGAKGGAGGGTVGNRGQGNTGGGY
jgi:hypothetical protein